MTKEDAMDQNNMSKANLIWDEYKYRHEHCWKLIFQITAAVVLLSIVPFSSESIAISLGYLITCLPLLGIVLTIFSIRRIRKELELWKAVRDKHILLQNSLDILKNPEGPESTFRRDVLIYLTILGFLGAVDIIVIIICWIPFVNEIANAKLGT